MADTALILAAELLLASRVRSAAKRAGFGVRQVRTAAAVADAPGLADGGSTLLVADLSLPGAIEACVAWSAHPGRAAIGFCPHVATDLIRAARAAGVDRVLVHSQLDGELPKVLQELAAGPDA
jgi:hypothetical protein